MVPIFIQAQNHPVLSKVKWYGSDGSTLNNKLIRNTEGALLSRCAIIIERAISLMVSGEIKVIMMVSGDHYWYQLVSRVTKAIAKYVLSNSNCRRQRYVKYQ